MSVGAFLGIGPSFVDQSAAMAFHQAISVALRSAGLAPYTDPPTSTASPTVGRFGRSSLDHHSADALRGLARRRGSAPALHLELVGMNPYRAAFLPIDFPRPLETEYVERIAGTATPIWIGSAYGLTRDLIARAPSLEIPVEANHLSDEIAARIDAGDTLHDADYGRLWESERTAWLLLVEGARLAVARRTAFSLAG